MDITTKLLGAGAAVAAAAYLLKKSREGSAEPEPALAGLGASIRGRAARNARVRIQNNPSRRGPLIVEVRTKPGNTLVRNVDIPMGGSVWVSLPAGHYNFRQLGRGRSFPLRSGETRTISI
jgi:hypothetical protein